MNNNNSLYNLPQFINDLKYKIQNIKEKKISDKDLSKFLGQREDYIRYAKKNYNRNPFYQLSMQELQEFKQNLKEIFKKESSKLTKIIRNYRKNNLIKIGRNKIYEYHPNFVENYFKNINSKEKAYWLGFIYADGSLGYKYGVLNKKGERYLRFRFGLAQNKLENIHSVKKFVKVLGIDMRILKNSEIKSKNGKIYQKLGFEISSQFFCRNLNQNGVIIGEKKTYNIQLPDFNKSELNLAFLLGYFDGDGTTGTNTITSASRAFLKQIKLKFHIPHKLRKTEGKAWRLSLGAELFNELMDNYKYSLPRKRRYFETKLQRSIRLKTFNKKSNNMQ